MTVASGRPVCVLGVGRSGTSLTARALNVLGVDLGPQETMLQPSEINPKGYWEQREVVDLNDEILAALGGEWWCPPPRPPGWELAEGMAGLRGRIADLVERSFARSSRWGFKDPRTTLTLPIWRAVLGELDYVICLRNPLEVRASAVGALPEGGDEIALWLHYGCEALRLTAGHRRVFVFYEEWLHDADEVAIRLERFLGGADGVRGRASERAASEWEPSLRRRRASEDDLARSDDVAIEARAFHFLVRELAAAERRDDPAARDRARALQAVTAALDGTPQTDPRRR